jgi:hypothetical protein
MFGVEVFMVSTSALVVGCSIGSVVVVWKSVDGCGCSVCGMCVVWIVVLAVVGTFSPAAYDEP